MTFKSTQDWLAYDAEHIWHPYTSMLDPSPVLPVVSAQDVYLELADGTQLIDGMSSWWSAIHGYNHPALNQALVDQSQKMSHVMFGGLTHQPAVTLGKKLIDLTCDNLQHVFFADSGSVAVEVAIKMAIQFWYAQGKKQKNKLLTVKNGYYGDTFGAMSVCDPVNGMHSLFEDVLAKQIFADAPPQCSSESDWNETHIADFENKIREHHTQLAAVIIEPIAQNAGGMRFYCAEYLRRVRKLCDKYDVLLILDEIATGFGRTGTLFAYEQADIQPDILTLGKTLTGGYLTLAATLTSKKIAEGISADGQGVLMHGPTFMANPLACSVASASIDVLLASDWQKSVLAIEAQMKQELLPCKQLAVVKDVRVKGAIGVVELHEPIDISWSQPRFTELGVWLRPFGKLVYIMPPYIIKKSELTTLSDAIFSVLNELK
ncbi:MAG TPA: adenosylmethionine--8-amino-7-oxononanoate transaminase [Leucothrix mucor]|nr:adenosylmethionine--8-amino-7-oxononanoate transaminase [Leucothrix mucor]